MAKELTLQEKIDAKHIAKTDWDTPKDNWEYISIPEEDAIGRKHATVSNNNRNFEAGKTYLVPPAVAVDVRERLKIFNRECVRILQPKRDYKSEQQVDKFGTGSAAGIGVQSVDPSTINQ